MPFPLATAIDQICGGSVTNKIDQYLTFQHAPTPFIVINLDIVREYYRMLEAVFPGAAIFYAVKANPAIEVIKTIAELGGKFDLASKGEIERCKQAGIGADRLSFGNTINREAEIAQARRWNSMDSPQFNPGAFERLGEV